MTSMTSSMTSITTALPTPAHSVNGSSLPSEMAHDIVMGEDSPQKRKRATDDLGERDQKKVQIEDRRLGIENLHLDVGEKYLLCRTRKAPFSCTERHPFPEAREARLINGDAFARMCSLVSCLVAASKGLLAAF